MPKIPVRLTRADTIRAERAWMEHCGGDAEGYMAKYGQVLGQTRYCRDLAYVAYLEGRAPLPPHLSGAPIAAPAKKKLTLSDLGL